MLQQFRESLENFRHVYPRSTALQNEDNISMLCSNFFYLWDYRAQIIYLYSKKKMHHPKVNSNLEVLSKAEEKTLCDSNPISCFRIRFKRDPQLALIKLKKKKDIVLIDLTGSYILTSETFRSYHKFGVIQYLCLSDCGIIEFPRDLLTFSKSIKSLDLSRNFISEIPTDIKWRQLEYLNLSENSFYIWPEAISPNNMPNLISIDLSLNSLASFPPFESGFPVLEFLSLNYNPFTILPPWLCLCSKIKFLTLKGCIQLANLSLESLFKLPNLDYLDISSLKLVDDLESIHAPANIHLLNCRGLKFYHMAADNLSVHNIEDSKEDKFFLDVVNPIVDNEFDNAFWNGP